MYRESEIRKVYCTVAGLHMILITRQEFRNDLVEGEGYTEYRRRGTIRKIWRGESDRCGEDGRGKVIH